jgi:hypothetical protein
VDEISNDRHGNEVRLFHRIWDDDIDLTRRPPFQPSPPVWWQQQQQQSSVDKSKMKDSKLGWSVFLLAD